MPQVYTILDRSGSMGLRVDEVIKGFNAFVKEQPRGTTFSLTQFDTDTKGVELTKTFEDVKRSKAVLSKENYVPRGMTPLLDAVGTTLEGVLKGHGMGERIVVLIITDGMENASSDYSLTKVNSLVQEARKRKFQVVFMGADIDAFGAARSMGIGHGQTMAYSGGQTLNAMASMSRSVSDYTSGITEDVKIEKEDQS